MAKVEEGVQDLLLMEGLTSVTLPSFDIGRVQRKQLYVA